MHVGFKTTATQRFIPLPALRSQEELWSTMILSLADDAQLTTIAHETIGPRKKRRPFLWD
jgi:hypothetical protein